MQSWHWYFLYAKNRSNFKTLYQQLSERFSKGTINSNQIQNKNKNRSLLLKIFLLIDYLFAVWMILTKITEF